MDWLEIGPVPSPSTFLDYAVIYRRQGTPCAFQYADDGSWFNLGDLYSVQLGGESNPPNIQYFTPDVTTDTVKSRFWAEGTFGGINTMLPSSSAYRWFRPSPDPESGDVQRIAATYSVLGESGIIFETDLDGRGSVLQRGYAPASVDTVATCWVGVNIP